MTRIRIIGGCGSGKSYTARELSRIYGIPYYETDNFVWDRSGDNTRNSPEVRDARIADTVAAESWIIEGVHHKWGIGSFREADLIFLIQPNLYVQDGRVIRRFIKTRLGLERGNYKQSFRNLYVMLFEWNRGFKKESLPAIMELTEEYKAKRIIVRNNREILQHVGRYMKEASLLEAGNRNHEPEDKMIKFATFIAEMLRLVVLLILTLLLLGSVEQWIFKTLYGWNGYLYTSAAGNFLVFFLLYRNYWQFKGWYKSEKNQKLKPEWTRIVGIAALLLILLPFAAPLLM